METENLPLLAENNFLLAKNLLKNHQLTLQAMN
jgi:hypothetical protein